MGQVVFSLRKGKVSEGRFQRIQIVRVDQVTQPRDFYRRRLLLTNPEPILVVGHKLHTGADPLEPDEIAGAATSKKASQVQSVVALESGAHVIHRGQEPL